MLEKVMERIPISDNFFVCPGSIFVTISKEKIKCLQLLFVWDNVAK